MSAYIRVDKDLVNDPRIGRLAEQLSQCMRVSWITGGNDVAETGEDLTDVENRNVLCNALRGSLVTLWWYADTHIRSDDTLPISVTALADVVGLPVEVLREFPGEWLMVGEDDTVVLPGYVEKNSLIAKEIRKEQTRRRVAKWRAARVTQSGNAPVTPVTAPRARVRALTRVRAPDPDPESKNTPLPPAGGGNGLLRKGEGRSSRDVRSLSAEAWNSVLNYVRNSGHRKDPHPDPIAQAAAYDIGGYQQIAMANEHEAALIKPRFRQAYEERLARARDTPTAATEEGTP